ncbi:MAG: hypothetical protein QOF71_2489 [Candidatus Eremiobacteraeota bacterium]|jgi:hypothetical protein|nr:hypothetical protein [Candidatus Eremiobacteraeota bacterium]
MSARDVDVDALFDRDADTQLLDRRRREELGLVPHVPRSSSTPARFGPESILVDEAPQLPRAAMLRVALDARPERELIPGAVVTVVATVHDDGEAPAADVLLRISVPPECEPLPNSFARGETALDGDVLLGEGVRIETIAPGDAVRVRFAMRVLSGTGPLDVIAHVSAPGVATVAAPALRLTRRAGHAAFDAPRPFFELETDETDDALTPVAAAEPEPPRTVDTTVDEPAAPVVIPPAPVIAPAVVVVADVVAVPEVVTEPEVVVKPYAPAVVIVKRPAPEPVVEEPVAAEPVAPEPIVVAEPAVVEPVAPKPVVVDVPRPYVLARTLDDEDVSSLERIFGGDVPHGLAALALLSSVAAVDTPLGEALGIRAFARAVATAVPRALIAARMSRPVPPVVTRESLDSIRPFAETPHDPYPQYFPLLVTRMDERELEALRAVLERDLDDLLLRGVQVLLAVAPRALEGVKSRATTSARDAMAEYRVAAGAWLMRVTVRRAVDRHYDPLLASDASLHEAGRRLVTALRGGFA